MAKKNKNKKGYLNLNLGWIVNLILAIFPVYPYQKRASYSRYTATVRDRRNFLLFCRSDYRNTLGRS